AVVLAAEFEHDAAGLAPTSKGLELFAQAALGVGRIGRERLPEGPLDLCGFDTQDPHRSAVSPDKAGIEALMHVSDRGLVEKITEAFLTLHQRLVRLAEFLAQPA